MFLFDRNESIKLFGTEVIPILEILALCLIGIITTIPLMFLVLATNIFPH